MTYRIDPQRSLTTEIRRVLRELLLDASGRCGSPNDEDVHLDVHEVRKSLKKARALLKLVRPHLPDYRARKDRYRDLGRSLGAVRDAAAVVESIDLLRPALLDLASAEAVDAARGLLVERRDEVTADAAARLRALHDDFTDAVAAVDGLRLQGPEEGAVVDGLRREYRRARKWAISLSADDDANDFHEWRKRVKEHRYHLELLLGEDPEVERTHELTDALGQIQDISVLLEVLAEDDIITPGLRELRQRRKTRALEIGRAYYEPEPDNRVAEIVSDWRR